MTYTEIARALGRIYASPGTPLASRAAFACAHCRKTLACLGLPS
jgi:hypothetical protein